MYFYENNFILPFNEIEDIPKDFNSVFLNFNNRKIGFRRDGKFFIDNSIIDLKVNVQNYQFKIVKNKTMEHNLLSNLTNVHSYNIGYSLNNTNEYFEFIIKASKDKIILHSLRNLNGIEEIKILPLEVK